MGYVTGICTLAGIQMIAVLGVTVFTGFTGLFSLGHAAFVALGAYGAGISTFRWHLPFPLALGVGVATATLASFVIGVPALRARLRSDYFAIAILGFGEALRVLLENLSLTNGARGLAGIPMATTPGAVLLCLLGSLLVVRRFLRSRLGSACIALREDPIAAEMAGVSPFRTRLFSLALSAALCGLSGGLLTHYLSFIQPIMFTLTQSTMLLAAVIAGGMGSVSGPLMASFLFTAIPEALRVAQMWRLVAFGLLLVLVMRFRPQGLLGFRELIDLLPARGRRGFPA